MKQLATQKIDIPFKRALGRDKLAQAVSYLGTADFDFV
jgi:hypothetical protein